MQSTVTLCQQKSGKLAHVPLKPPNAINAIPASPRATRHSPAAG